MQKRDNWKEKRQIKSIKDVYMTSPGVARSVHSPTTSTCTKFRSESRECWLENVDHVPSLKVFHLVLAWDEKDKFTRFYGFLFLFQGGICKSGGAATASGACSELRCEPSTEITPGTSLTQSRDHKLQKKKEKKRASNLHVLEHKSTCRQSSCTHTVISNKLNLWEKEDFVQL